MQCCVRKEQVLRQLFFILIRTGCRPGKVIIVTNQAKTSPFGAAYIRVSTDDQVELSPESQLEEIRKYAQREGILLLEDQIYIDAGISGKKAERRPEFMRMIAAAKSPNCPFSVILLWKYSRFARNQEESIFYKSILRSKCGIDVVSVTEPLIAGPFGSLIERIIEWMDEFYSIRLSQEVKRSMRVNAERGKLQATASFGYRAKDGKLIPDEKEAVYVRRIFDSFLSGKGIYVIARELNAMGIRTHRGNPFENRTVEYILRNPVYTGKLRWNPAGRTRRDFFNENIILADGGHEPLVSEETWNAAQRQLDAVKAQWGYKARPASELKGWTSGIVRCAACGATLIFVQPHYYKCNNYARGRCKHSQHIRAEALEEAIITRLTKDTSSTSPLAYNITYTNAGGGHELARLEATVKQLRVKRGRLQEAYLAGVLDLKEFSSAKTDIESSISKAEAELDELQTRSDTAIVENQLQTAITQALATLQSPDASLEEKNSAARSVIENCTFDKENSLLTITYRVVI